MHQQPVADTTSARVLFRVGFESDMRAEDADRLRRNLNMTMHLDRKHPAITPPLGITRLDRDSGLFLMCDAEHEWTLECRTWGDPPVPVVRSWWVTTLFGARQLDDRAPRPDARLRRSTDRPGGRTRETSETKASKMDSQARHRE